MKIMQAENKEKRILLLKATAEIVKELRTKTGKSISLISNELNISKSIWSDIELAKTDIQMSTFWRIAEALEIQPDELIRKIKNNLSKSLTFIE